MSENNAVLEIRGLNKSFGSTKANVDINVTFMKGEVHGIAGENGSGKSTLLSQLAGMLESDSGEVFLKGQPYKPSSPVDAMNNSIAMVVQELGVIGNLPAGINIYLGRMDEVCKRGIVNFGKIRKNVKEVRQEWHLPEYPLGRRCDLMNVEQRKMIELTRALSVNPDILILDEITQALSHNNRKLLYEIIAKLRDQGKTIILITHDIEEMVEITDRITVMRDGHVIETLNSCDVTANQIKSKMVNRELDGDFYRSDNEPSWEDEVVISVKDVSVEGSLDHLSFDLHKGEILGFCGLSDSGIHDVGKAMYGLFGKKNVTLTEGNIQITDPITALNSGIGYLPKDRDGEGLMMDNDICDNFCVPSYRELSSKIGTLTNRTMYKASDAAMKRFNVKAEDSDTLMNSLSGGNKQKVNLGRWLIKDLKVMILDCPTRGVDIGVKAYIYKEMMEAKKAGLAIVLISDELLEALGMSDRLMVVNSGRVVMEMLRGEDFTEEKVIGVMI